MSEQSFTGRARAGRRRSVGPLERMAAELFTAMQHAQEADTKASERGLLQTLDPRTKLIGLLILLITVLGSRSLLVIYSLIGISVLLALASRVSLRATMKRTWLSVLLFTGSISLPALFLVEGDTICRLPWLGWVITWQGLHSFGFVTGRALAAASLAVLLMATTPWPHVMKALRTLGVPAVFIIILAMTYRYIFLLLKNALDLLEAKRSRMPIRPGRREARRLAIGDMAVLLEKSMQLSHEVYLAMLARGYRGGNTLLDEFSMAARDWLALICCIALAVLAFLWPELTGHG